MVKKTGKQVSFSVTKFCDDVIKDTYFNLNWCSVTLIITVLYTQTFVREVQRWFNQNYPDRRIGRSDPVPWPPRSPDLNPCDFACGPHETVSIPNPGEHS